jgi:hypothetical protein
MRYNFIILLTLITIISCTKKSVSKDPLKTVFNFPKKLSEISGIVVIDSLIWVIQDSGNDAKVFGVSKEGEIRTTISIQNSTNEDWEDLTIDSNNNLYIGDFGNNANNRRDLCIYKIQASDLNSSEVNPKEKIRFFYPEQKSFPPKKNELFYDCEAFFEHNGHFYLVTKNRSKGFDGTTYVYKVPNKAGTHPALLMGSFKTCDTFNTCAITGAAISNDGKKVVMLSHSKLWLFEEFISDDFLKGKMRKIELNHNSQKESVFFKDTTTLLIADERTKKIGGKVYEYSLH